MSANKEKKEEKKAELMELAQNFSREYLDEEYEEVVEKLIAKMVLKRDGPFMAGRTETWAAAVIHALGTINFLFDDSIEPYASVDDISSFFGTKNSTVTRKSKTIRDMFKMNHFDAEFSTKTMSDSDPMNNFKMLDGFIVPKDFNPHELIWEDYPELDEEGPVEDWEVAVASILGTAELEEGQDYYMSYLDKVLAVNMQSLKSFYVYLKRKLRFPFPVLIEAGADPFNMTVFELECLGYAPGREIDEAMGIVMECRAEGGAVFIPLAELEAAEDGEQADLLDLYQEWFWSLR